ncbi:MAG: glycosyltransferase family 4 protein [Burkholderiaceae bacterium]|nr:glycosyltransferase family 4 protein [Burkholderiaceae bacterium]
MATPRDDSRLQVLTWHVHGNYLYYLSQAAHDFHLVTLPGHPPGHAGRVGRLPWGPNVHEVAAEEVAQRRFDCVLYQSRRHWDEDRLHRLSEAQRALPAVYLEHDPPQQHPTATRHPAADSDAHIVHVTSFNALMWDNGDARTRVIEHGVLVPDDARYRGDRDEGIVVVNHLRERGRRLGADVFERVRERVALTLVGMGSEAIGGAGEIPNLELPGFVSRFRFFFNPIRYTSLGLSVLEAMTVGVPVIALATTEMPTVIRNGVNGYADTNVDALVDVMRTLIDDRELARRWGEAARADALARFSIERFAREWTQFLREVVRDG